MLSLVTRLWHNHGLGGLGPTIALPLLENHALAIRRYASDMPQQWPWVRVQGCVFTTRSFTDHTYVSSFTRKTSLVFSLANPNPKPNLLYARLPCVSTPTHFIVLATAMCTKRWVHVIIGTAQGCPSLCTLPVQVTSNAYLTMT